MAEVYRWPKEWGDEPILTMKKGEVFVGRKREGFFPVTNPLQPLLTADGCLPRLPQCICSLCSKTINRVNGEERRY